MKKKNNFAEIFVFVENEGSSLTAPNINPAIVRNMEINTGAESRGSGRRRGPPGALRVGPGGGGGPGGAL